MSQNNQPQPRFRFPHSPRLQPDRGFTLVEVMIAALVMVIALLGLLGSTIRAYQLSAEARYRDQARALLQSEADEFLRREVTSGTPPTVVPFFQTSLAERSDFLTWNTIPGSDPSHLGGDPNGPTATVTRWIQDIDEDPANAGSTLGEVNQDNVTVTNAGKMLFATFAVTYQVNGRNHTEKLTIARTVTQ